MLKVAMLSKWHVHAGGYAEEFKAAPGVEITVVWDEDKTRGAEWAKEIGCEFEPDLDKLLARSDVDAVCVGTPTTSHREVICKAANAKKAIFTEKVLATTNEDAEAIAEAVRKNKVPFTIALRRRTDPRVLHAKSLVEKGAVGRVTHIRIRDAHNGTCAGWLPDTFYNKSMCGGGAMMDLGAHPMYISLYFMGEPVSVSSVFTQGMGKGVDDNCITVMQYADGAVGTSETAFISANCPFSLEINGTEGHLLVKDGMDGILLSNKDGSKIIPESELGQKPLLPVGQFAAAVQKGETPPFNVDDALALTRIMVAAYTSAEKSTSCKL